VTKVGGWLKPGDEAKLQLRQADLRGNFAV